MSNPISQISKVVKAAVEAVVDSTADVLQAVSGSKQPQQLDLSEAGIRATQERISQFWRDAQGLRSKKLNCDCSMKILPMMLDRASLKDSLEKSMRNTKTRTE